VKFVILVFVILLILLQYRLWFGHGSLPEVQRFAEIKQSKIEENQRLKERNKSLAAEVLDLKQGMEAIEERARSEMGMIKNNETFYQIVDESDVVPKSSIEQ
jgi:cell division protein FtsB